MIAVILFALAFVGAIVEGFALSVMWSWFIVPVFHAPALSIPYAIGLALVVSMLTHRTRKSEDDPEPFYVVAMGFVMPLVFLGCGWIVKLFVV